MDYEEALLQVTDVLKAHNRHHLTAPDHEQAVKLIREIVTPKGKWVEKEDYVGDTYFDYGQNWKWTVVLCECTDGDRYQALTPREWEEVVNDKRPQNDNMKDLFNGKYCPDKIRGK